MPESVDIAHLAHLFIVYRTGLQKLVKPVYAPEICPLREDHPNLSQAIWGTLKFRWTCGLCGCQFDS